MTLKLMKLAAICFLIAGATTVHAQDLGYQKEMEAAHKTMMEDMGAMKSTGDPDKDFAMMMIPHHQGAIDMAQIQLKYGKDPALKKMAQDIIDAQQREIDDFKKWEGAHH
ncbi:MAG: DUF305 domain-containing protein [Parvibaculaceae bacterium]